MREIKKTDLARLGSDLGGRALGALLALDATSTTLGGGGSGLGLVGLLGGSGGGLLLLGLLDGLLAGGLTGLRALRAALLDHIKGGTDDGTLGLHDTAGTLLGNLLYMERFQVSNCYVGSVSPGYFVQMWMYRVVEFLLLIL